MEQHFKPLTGGEAFMLEVVGSAGPVVLFKHDPHCPISRAAYREMSQLADSVVLVDVARQEALSQEITARTGIKHESPQVIVFDGGRPRWSASHYDITHEAVAEALQQS